MLQKYQINKIKKKIIFKIKKKTKKKNLINKSMILKI